MELRPLTVCACACLISSSVCGAADWASRRPIPAVALPKVMVNGLAFAVMGSVTVSPPTITFSSPDPDTTPVNGSATATVAWRMTGGPNKTWSLALNATSASFAGCPSVPVSAVQFSCQSVTPGDRGDGNCAGGTFTLSTTPSAPIASGGKQGGGQSHFVVVIGFTFTDAWKYPANSSCTLTLTYTASGE